VVTAERAERSDNLRLAFELFEAGEAMYRQKVRRKHPDWSDEAVEEAVDEWLQRADVDVPPASPVPGAQAP